MCFGSSSLHMYASTWQVCVRVCTHTETSTSAIGWSSVVKNFQEAFGLSLTALCLSDGAHAQTLHMHTHLYEHRLHAANYYSFHMRAREFCPKLARNFEISRKSSSRHKRDPRNPLLLAAGEAFRAATLARSNFTETARNASSLYVSISRIFFSLDCMCSVMQPIATRGAHEFMDFSVQSPHPSEILSRVRAARRQLRSSANARKKVTKQEATSERATPGRAARCMSCIRKKRVRMNFSFLYVLAWQTVYPGQFITYLTDLSFKFFFLR